MTPRRLIPTTSRLICWRAEAGRGGGASAPKPHQPQDPIGD
jgi:hypothetical protein